MLRQIKQFRFYGTGNTNNNPSENTKAFFTNNTELSAYMPIIHLGIQTLPGTRFFINENWDAPIIVGATGIYELDLSSTTGLISSLQFDINSLNIIDRTPTGYLIMDIVYEVEES